MPSRHLVQSSAWMLWVMIAAGLYSLLWGVCITLWPSLLIHSFATTPDPFEHWRGAGMIAGVLGVGYLAAAANPRRHWPIVLVGLLTKIGVLVVFLHAVAVGQLPWSFNWNIFFTDIIWLIPFFLILVKAYALRQGVIRQISPAVQEMALRSRTNKGLTLLEMSKRQPILLVFLRQFGCSFCRETLSDLSKQRKAIEGTGTQIVLIHMAADQKAHDVFQFYGLSDLPRISDNNRLVYRAFGIGRGGLLKLFGPSATWRFIFASVFIRHGVGWVVGDAFQMPGIFLIFQGLIVRSFLHRSVADRPNYVRMAQLGIDDGSGNAVAS